MKKMIMFLALICFAVNLMGQASGSTITFLPNQTIKTVTTTASDTVNGTATKYWIFALNKPKLQYYSYLIELDTFLTPARIHGNRVQIKSYGSLDGNTWVQFNTTGFYNINAGTNGDSTFAYSDVATGNLWKYYKLEFLGIVATHTTKVAKISLKVADK